MENPPVPASLSLSSRIPLSVNQKRQRPSTKLSDEKKNVYKAAWVVVKEGRLNVYKAAKKYNLSHSTLWQWCQKNDIDDSIPTVGRPCFLGNQLEEKLKKWIFEAASTGKLLLNKKHF